MPGLAVWSCLIYLTRINHCHPLPPRWPWRWIGPRSRAAAAPKVPAYFNKTSSTSTCFANDEANGMVYFIFESSRLVNNGQSTRLLGAATTTFVFHARRTSSNSSTKATTRLLPSRQPNENPQLTCAKSSVSRTQLPSDLQC